MARFPVIREFGALARPRRRSARRSLRTGAGSVALAAEILLSTKCQNCAILPLAVPAEKRIMAYQRGSLKKVRRKEGEIWVLRYRVTNSDGRRVENVMPIGLVREFPKAKDARREADRSDSPSESTTALCPAASVLIFLRSTTS